MEESEAFEPASLVCQIVVDSKLEQKLEREAYKRGISLLLPQSSTEEMHPEAKQPDQKRNGDSCHLRGLKSSFSLSTVSLAILTF